ncbi:MAG: hypothetical protein ACREHV_07710 [Rhizomicrobium sp.]
MNQYDELKRAASSGSSTEMRADSLISKFSDLVASNRNSPTHLDEIVGAVKENHFNLAKSIAGK